MGDTIWDWDKTAANNATSDSAINWSEGQLPSTVNNSAREMMAKIAYLLEDISSSLVTGGIGNAYTVSPGKPPSDLTKGWIGVVRFDRANTGAATFQVGSLAAASLVDAEGNALTGGEIVANGIYLVNYNPTNGTFHLVNRVPLHAGEVGTAQIADASITPAKIDSTQNFTFGITYADAFVSDKNQSNANEGGRIAFEPPTNAVNIDTTSKWNSMVGIYTDGLNDFFKFTWKDSGGVWRSYRLPIDAGGHIWTDGDFAARIAALTANTAPVGTESVACDNGQKVTLAQIANTADFTSGALTITQGAVSVHTVAHGLGVVPSRVRAFLVCVIGEYGYVAGDIIEIGGSFQWWSNSSGSRTVQVAADSTTIYFHKAILNFYAVTKGGTTINNLTASNWELYLQAWK